MLLMGEIRPASTVSVEEHRAIWTATASRLFERHVLGGRRALATWIRSLDDAARTPGSRGPEVEIMISPQFGRTRLCTPRAFPRRSAVRMVLSVVCPFLKRSEAASATLRNAASRRRSVHAIGQSPSMGLLYRSSSFGA